MSVIDVDHVESVMLADGWHRVTPRSFTLQAYQLVKATAAQAAAGEHEVLYPSPSGTPPLGFAFTEQDSITGELRHIGGPLSSVLAVEYTARPGAEDEEGER